MEYHELGRTGVKVSFVGVGTWQWGVRGWGWSPSHGLIPENSPSWE